MNVGSFYNTTPGGSIQNCNIVRMAEFCIRPKVTHSMRIVKCSTQKYKCKFTKNRISTIIFLAGIAG